MKNEFTAVYETDGDWVIGYCLEIAGANVQGRSKELCRRSLSFAIEQILADRRENAIRGLPDGADIETITIP